MPSDCIFCKIFDREIEAPVVYEDEQLVVFLDKSPLFPGHCLVSPKMHYGTLPELPTDLLTSLFSMVQRVSVALEEGLDADGSFVAVNNKISQSVPHLHIHVVPRRKGDGLKGFFWPRHPYRNQEHAEETRLRLKDALNCSPILPMR